MSKFQPAPVDQAKLQAFMGKMVGDMKSGRVKRTVTVATENPLPLR